MNDEEWCRTERVPTSLLERARTYATMTFHASGHEFDARALALAFRDVRNEALEEAAIMSERGDDSPDRIRKLKSVRALALEFRDVRDDALEEAAVASERGDDSPGRIRKLKSAAEES